MRKHKYTDPGIIKRYDGNPILTSKGIPYPCKLVFNPAACKYDDKYVIIPRIVGNDWEECLGIGFSDNGYDFQIESKPLLIPQDDDVGKMNDPRITFLDGWFYLTYCSDPSYPDRPPTYGEGIYLCIAKSKDLRNWIRIYKSEPDNRNAVIFPEKINGLFVRLDRPFARGYRTVGFGYDIWISFSPDMEFWGRHKLLLSHLDIPWGSNRVGPGAPPIKTNEGWLCIFHGEFIPSSEELSTRWIKWANGQQTRVCFAGAMLLDLEDPTIVRAVAKYPIMVPTEPYEFDPTYRPSVVFPTATILEPSGELKIYYGSSDAHISVATTNVSDLIDFVLKERMDVSKLKVQIGGLKYGPDLQKKKLMRV